MSKNDNKPSGGIHEALVAEGFELVDGVNLTLVQPEHPDPAVESPKMAAVRRMLDVALQARIEDFHVPVRWTDEDHARVMAAFGSGFQVPKSEPIRVICPDACELTDEEVAAIDAEIGRIKAEGLQPFLVITDSEEGTDDE